MCCPWMWALSTWAELKTSLQRVQVLFPDLTLARTPTAELFWRSLQESTPKRLRTFTAVSCCSCRSLIKPSVIEEGISAGGPLLLGIAWSGQALTNGSLSGSVKMSGSSAAMSYPGEATSATVDSKW